MSSSNSSRIFVHKKCMQVTFWKRGTKNRDPYPHGKVGEGHAARSSRYLGVAVMVCAVVLAWLRWGAYVHRPVASTFQPHDRPANARRGATVARRLPRHQLAGWNGKRTGNPHGPDPPLLKQGETHVRRPDELHGQAVTNVSLLSRLRYYVHGHVDQASRAAAAAPARAAAVQGVATAEPVTGRGRLNSDSLRSRGRILLLNASICAAGPVPLASEIERQIGRNSPVARQGALPAYVADACAVAPVTSAAYVVGDVGSCFSAPVFAKARPCGCTTTTLLNLNRVHHFGFDTAALDAADTPWPDKLPVAFWRGAATGAINDNRQAARYHLLTRWANTTDARVDVGMTILPMTTGNATRDAQLKACSKTAVSRPVMLRHRYLISAEGYDVATNLKWALWSKSAVIMPRPTMCSWLMEDRLEPWVHYVPVAPDFSNLTAAVDWCERAGNVGVCERIGAAGREYMEEHRFMDVEADLAVGREVAAMAISFSMQTRR